MKKHYLSLKPFIQWPETERPVDWTRRFGREAPLEVEIGFGNGEYLAKHAQDNPERNFVGIEVGWGGVRRTLRKISKAGLTNVRLLLADSRLVFQYLLAPASLQRVYSLFPMPWPKEHHVKHRVFSHQFLRLLNNRLVAGGEARIVTDFEPYARWVKEQVPDSGFIMDVTLTHPSFDTKYERKWCEQGQETFFEIRLVKQQHQLDRAVKEEQPVKTYCVDHFDPDHFDPVSDHGEVVVEFKDYLYDPARKKAMTRAVVVEDELTQHVWIEIARGEAQWFIHLAPGCCAVPSVGVQRAVDLVYEAVASKG